MMVQRLAWLQCVCTAMLFALSATHAVAAPAVTTVYPTGIFPLDVQNVQAAIDRGGAVLLKAANEAGQPTAFDFGPADAHTPGNGVDLTTDVTISGERIGPYATTIRGGYAPFLGQVAVKTAIQNIDFEGPLDSPIVLIRSAGSDIVGNRIKGIIPVRLSIGFSETEGIFISGFDDPQNGVTGQIRIIGNTIEISSGDFANGMQVDEVRADLEVSGNTVTFPASNGVVQSIGILVIRTHGKVNIVGNSVTMGPGDPDVFPSGMFIGGHPESRYNVSRNTVVTQHPNSDGIDVVGLGFLGATQSTVLEGNDVTMQSSLQTSGGICLCGAVRDSVMTANRLKGAAGNAIQMVSFGSNVPESNRAVGNDLAQFSPLNGDAFFGTGSIGNLLAGQCDSYIDDGINNRILCGTAFGATARAARIADRPRPAIGDAADDIHRARRDAMRNRLAQ